MGRKTRNKQTKQNNIKKKHDVSRIKEAIQQFEVVEVYLITAEKCLWAHIFWKRLNELLVFLSVCSGTGMSEFLKKCNFLSF